MTKDLLKGLTDFKRYHYADDNSRMRLLAEMGQDPKYFIISCIDSRCNPVSIFRAQPGIFFTHKAMGAIVRPYQKGTALSAALQFALKYNNIESIIIMGHTGCGAVKALADGLDDEEIKSFVEIAKTAHEKAEHSCETPDNIIACTEKEVILESIHNLKKYPSVENALKQNKIDVKAWLFDMKAGDLFEHNNDNDDFELIELETLKEDSRQNA